MVSAYVFLCICSQCIYLGVLIHSHIIKKYRFVLKKCFCWKLILNDDTRFIYLKCMEENCVVVMGEFLRV